jgi:acyl carrier protein
MPLSNSNEIQQTASVTNALSLVSVPKIVPSVTEIQAWLVAHLAESLELEPQAIETRKDFTDYGLNSIELVNISGELELFLGCRLDPTLVLNYPNIEALSKYLGLEHFPPSISDHPASVQVDAAHMLATLDQMSDQEVEGLLSSLLSEDNVENA